MQEKTANYWGDALRLIQACPLCDASYNPMEASVILERDDSHLVHVQCRKGSNAILALVLVSPVGIMSQGMVTDLTVEDVMRFREGAEVSMDDAIGTHKLLHDDMQFIQAVMAV